MLMDILNSEMTIGLSEEELLGTCETVSSTIHENKVPIMAIPRRDIVNTTSLSETADVISKTATKIDTVPSATVCNITTGSTTYFDVRADNVVSEQHQTSTSLLVRQQRRSTAQLARQLKQKNLFAR